MNYAFAEVVIVLTKDQKGGRETFSMGGESSTKSALHRVQASKASAPIPNKVSEGAKIGN